MPRYPGNRIAEPLRYHKCVLENIIAVVASW